MADLLATALNRYLSKLGYCTTLYYPRSPFSPKAFPLDDELVRVVAKLASLKERGTALHRCGLDNLYARQVNYT
jgi:hypothetical protein